MPNLLKLNKGQLTETQIALFEEIRAAKIIAKMSGTNKKSYVYD